MAKEPTPGFKSIDYVVAFGVLSGRDAKNRPTEIGVGQSFTPADDDERDSLLASGRIVPASEAAALVAPANAAAAQVAVQAASARADAAEARVAELEKTVADQVAEIAVLKAAGVSAPTANAAPAK